MNTVFHTSTSRALPTDYRATLHHFTCQDKRAIGRQAVKVTMIAMYSNWPFNTTSFHLIADLSPVVFELNQFIASDVRV